MKYFIFGFFCFFFIGPAYAQNSIGFKSPKNIQSILDYRLPSWGHSTLKLDFMSSGSGNLSNQNNSSRFYARVGPAYNRYYESEKNIWLLNTDLGLDYNYENNPSSKSSSKDIDYRFFIDSSWNHYYRQQSYFSLGGRLSGSYSNYEFQSAENNLTERSSKYLSGKINFGFGFGRIRDITPLIQALRFNERLHSLGRNMKLENEDIHFIAREFAKQGGYSRVYDRRNKYFWKTIYDRIDTISEEISPFELHYLAESLVEFTGNRFNGQDIVFEFDYSDFYRKPEINNGQFFRKSLLGISSIYRFYKNLSLTNQIGFKASIHYNFFSLGQQSKRHSDGYLQFMANHLWVVSDRLLLQSQLSSFISLKKLKKRYFGQIYHTSKKYYNMRVQFQYFIENTLALHSRIDISRNITDQEVFPNSSSNTSWNYSIGLIYYIHRNLL